MPSYLRHRRHTWFFQWKWPSRLAAFGFSGELIRSLKTGDFRITRRRALTLVLKIEPMTSSTDLPKRAETGGLDFFECHEIEKLGREDASELDGLFRFASNLFAPQEKAAIAR